MKTIIFLLLFVFSATNLYTQDYRDEFIGVYKCKRIYNEYNIIDTVLLYFEKNPVDTLMYLTDSTWSYQYPGMSILVDSFGSFFAYPISFPFDGNFFPDADSVFMIRDGGDSPNGHIFWFYYGKKINTSSINDYSKLNNLIKAYPNPVNNMLYIKVPLQYFNTVAKYEVFDYTGKSVVSENLNHDGYIDFSNRSKGIYFLKIDLNNTVFCKKLIKN